MSHSPVSGREVGFQHQILPSALPRLLQTLPELLAELGCLSRRKLSPPPPPPRWLICQGFLSRASCWAGRGGERPLAGPRRTGVPQGQDPPRQHRLPPPPAPGSPNANRCFAWAGGQARGPCQGAWPEAPAPPRRVLTWGVWQSRRAESCPGGREGAAERATAAATAPAAAPAAAAAAGGGRKETLASPEARLGQPRGAWGEAGFGPAWGRMVNLEPMHPGEGRRARALTGVTVLGQGRMTGAPLSGGLVPQRPGEGSVDSGSPRAGGRRVRLGDFGEE